MQSSEHQTGNWQKAAYCGDRDPNLFFSEDTQEIKLAKAICSKCVVRSECLEYAINNEELYGIWGGQTQREINRIRHRRAVARRFGAVVAVNA